jgi:hypothetical protein
MPNQHTKRREDGVREGGDILTPPPSAADEPVNEQALPIEDDPSRWTINGEPVHPNMRHLIAFRHTDQWRELNAHLLLQHEPFIQVTCDAQDKQFDRFADADALQVWEGGIGNPLDTVAKQHCRPGERPRFLSDTVVKEKGLRGWRPKIGPNGEPIKVGNLTLATMPEERAQKRDAYYRNLRESRAQMVQETFQEQQDRLQHAAGVSALPANSTVRDRDTSRAVRTGLHQTTGDIPE